MNIHYSGSQVTKWESSSIESWCAHQRNFFSLFIYSYVHTMIGPFLPPVPAPPSSSNLLRFQAQPVLPLPLILLKRRHKHNKEDKVFLIVELRIAIQRDSSIASMHKCFTTRIDSSLTDLYTGSWPPSRVDLCPFKVSVLVPLEWGDQTLTCFGFLPISIPPVCALPLSCDPNPTTLVYLP
jgi:hypothetical protein